MATTVYLLTAEFSQPETGNTMEWQNGITTVHATLDGALAHFDHWLDSNGIDRDAAHYGESRHVETEVTFVGGDPDPDTLEVPTELHWGINLVAVRP